MLANGLAHPGVNRGLDHTAASALSGTASLAVGLAVNAKIARDICPTCGAMSLVYQEGCAKCFACGHSEC